MGRETRSGEHVPRRGGDRVQTTLSTRTTPRFRQMVRAPTFFFLSACPSGRIGRWAYAVQHHVQLPDEYDEIFEDIEPFWGIHPTELARAQEMVEKQDGVVTIEKTDGHPRLEIVRSTLTQEKPALQVTVDDILALVRDVEQDVPPLRLTLSPYDNPGMLSDWRIKTMAREAAANGTSMSARLFFSNAFGDAPCCIALTRADLPTVTESGWIQACPPDSPARMNPPASTPPSSPKTFIASHRETMNPCAHPSLLTTHGQFLSHKNGPSAQRTLVPRFSLCGTLLHHDIRPPVPYGWEWGSDSDPDKDEEGAFNGDLPWERKVDERLDWRGRTTGMYASPDTPWVHGHRARLVTLANVLEGNVSVLHVPENEDEDPVGEPEMVRLARVNPAWMDIAFTAGPIACDKNGGTCNEMEKLWEFRRVQPRHEEGRYKFILDVSVSVVVRGIRLTRR